MISETDIPPAQLLGEKPSRALSRPGVYAIMCDTNGRYYIGSSANIAIRIRHHYNSLLSGKHYNPRMQHSFSKYGGKGFIFRALDFTEKNSSELINCERRWIQSVDAVNSGFNVMPAANCPLGVVRKDRANFISAAKSRSENQNSRSNRKYRFVSPLGELFEGFNVARFCRDNGFTKGITNGLQRLAKGDIGSYNGWTSLNVGVVGRRRGLPMAYSLTDKNGVVHTGDNISEFCRSLGLHRGFFSALISKGMKNQAGWTVTAGFDFNIRNRKKETFYLISPREEKVQFSSVSDFSVKHGLNPRCLRLFLSTNATKYKGWTKTKCT